MNLGEKSGTQRVYYIRGALQGRATVEGRKRKERKSKNVENQSLDDIQN